MDVYRWPSLMLQNVAIVLIDGYILWRVGFFIYRNSLTTCLFCCRVL